MTDSNTGFSYVPPYHDNTLEPQTLQVFEGSENLSAPPQTRYEAAESAALSHRLGCSVDVHSHSDGTRDIFGNHGMQVFAPQIPTMGGITYGETSLPGECVSAFSNQDGSIIQIRVSAPLLIQSIIDCNLSAQQQSLDASGYAEVTFAAVTSNEEMGYGPPPDQLTLRTNLEEQQTLSPPYTSFTQFLMQLSMTPHPAGIGWLPFPDTSLPGCSRAGLIGAAALMAPFQSPSPAWPGLQEPVTKRLRILDLFQRATRGHQIAFEKTLEWWFPADQSSVISSWVWERKARDIGFGEWLGAASQAIMIFAFRSTDGDVESRLPEYRDLIAILVDPSTTESSDLFHLCRKHLQEAVERDRQRREFGV